MSATLLEPPTTEEQLRERAANLAEMLESAETDLQPDSPDADAQIAQEVERRRVFFETVRRDVMSLASSPAWRAHDLTTELLLLVERLRDVISADPDASDPEWLFREVLQRMQVVLSTMIRQLMHDVIDRPEVAAHFVAEALADVEVSEVAALLGTTSKTVNTYRKGEVGQIRKNPNRVTLVGQLVSELKGSMTPRGVLLWFDAQMPALDGRTPRDLIEEDPAAHRPALIALARGGRAQLDQGGVAYGAVEQSA